MKEPTYEQIACATRIAAISGFAYVSCDFFSQYDEATGKHDRSVAILCVNVNDLWGWACADCEHIEWEHVEVFEAGLRALMAERNGLARDNPKAQRRLGWFCPAYVAVKRGEGDPQNWLDHFERVDGKYRKMNEEERAEWETAKAWWAERIRSAPTASETEAWK